MEKSKKIIVIIPARGGSKRLPGKNIFPLAGKPLIAYPIEAAKKAKLVDRIIISTDDKEIAKVARRFGAEVPFMRPEELATDTSPVIEAIIYTVKKLEQDEGFKVDYTILLQPTTPLIEPKQIDEAIKIALEKNADSVVAVAPVDTINHPYNIREILEDGTIRFWQYKLHYELLGKPKPKFYHAANLWLSSYGTLLKTRKLEGKKNYPLIVEPIYSLDIDLKEDAQFIEAWLQYKRKGKNEKGKKKK